MEWVKSGLLVLLLLLIGCSSPNRLDEPPAPNPICIENNQPCEFDQQCCSEFCWRNQCVDRNDLIIPDAGCTPDQVDIALVIDLSDSMDQIIEDVLEATASAVDLIPPTTTIQVWVTPSSAEEDGEYHQLSPPGPPEMARDAIRSLNTSTTASGGMEATLDATYELLRSRSAWRFGTSVRAIIVISDEGPHSYQIPSVSMDDVCAEVLPSDRLMVFTKSLISSTWGCYEKHSIWSTSSLHELLIDPCTMIGDGGL